MKRFLGIILLTIIIMLFSNPPIFPAEKTAAEKPSASKLQDELVIADFNTGEKPNNLGGDFGSWDKDPDDETQSCRMSFESDDAMGDASGYSIRLDYDVDSPNSAYNGFWMKLSNVNALEYNTINLALRGDSKKGYTKTVKLELKDSAGSSFYVISGITDHWQKFSIPLEKFKKIRDWNTLAEFVLVFDDVNTNPKVGSIYMDQITFSKE